MKKKFSFLTSFLFLMIASLATANAQEKKMAWTTSSSKASELCKQGVDYFLNIEFAQAYEKFNSALELDPEFTVPLVLMTAITGGELKKGFVARAANSTSDKTPGEQLFASFASDKRDTAAESSVFQKLYAMFPEDNMIGALYVFTRRNPEDQLKSCEAYRKKFAGQAWTNNILGYYYMTEKKDFAMAKKYFDAYIAEYPQGCNPYDSMGEYYFNKKDKENSKKYYEMSLDKYPFNNSAFNKLKEIKESSQKKEGM